MYDATRQSPARSAPRDHHVTHDPSGMSKLSTTVVHALADVMGEDVTDVSFVLADSVDPDALDRLFGGATDDRPRSAGHVAFTVDGYEVTVYGTGQIVITPPASRPRERV